MSTENQVHVIEVGPRDGFQNISEYIPLETKLHLIDQMVDARVHEIEITSFVHPKLIPQLRDAKELAGMVLEKYPEERFSALVPNLYGAKSAYECGVRKVVYVVSCSESHNKANINRTHLQSQEELMRIQDSYSELEICVDVATAFGCPFEGKFQNPTKLVEFMGPYVEAGVKTFCLCDTIGIAAPKQVQDVLEAVKRAYPDLKLEVHIHDTRNMGIANTLKAVECGVSGVQSTLGGLGGCPFAPGASGNTATEDLVYALNEMGYETGIDFEKLLRAAQYEYEVIPGNYSGHHIKIGGCRS